ncbi:hypothetical protein BC829DRAFT_381857 [Chytridium lagenaria]|nr:hypothetical protein BC829DRAFT_381857 [Chytridium lagenaria]
MAKRPQGSSRFALRPACGLEGWEESEAPSDTSDTEGNDLKDASQDLSDHDFGNIEAGQDDFEPFPLDDVEEFLENWTEAESRFGEMFPEIHPFFIRQTLKDCDDDFSLAAGMLTKLPEVHLEGRLENSDMAVKLQKLRIMFPDVSEEATEGDVNNAAVELLHQF